MARPKKQKVSEYGVMIFEKGKHPRTLRKQREEEAKQEPKEAEEQTEE